MNLLYLFILPDSEVDDNSQRSILRSKGHTSPIITGLPVSDGSSVNTTLDLEILMLLSDVNVTIPEFSGRRRMQAAPHVNASSWYLSGYLNRDLALDGCQLLADGHNTYQTKLTETSTDPLDASEIEFLTMHEVTITAVSGCNGNSQLIMHLKLDGEPAEVKCPKDSSESRCGLYEPMFVHTNATMLGNRSSEADEGFGNRRRRRLEELTEAEVDAENNWIPGDTEGNEQRRRLGGGWLYFWGDPVCGLGKYPDVWNSQYKWCSIPYFYLIRHYLDRFGVGWVYDGIFIPVATIGGFRNLENGRICISNYNVYWYGARPVKDSKCESDCFPAHAEVEVEVEGQPRMVRMDELNYGNRVKTVDSSSGEVEFKTVYLFGHIDHEKSTQYVNLHTANSSLQLSPTHYASRCTANCDDDGIKYSNYELEDVFAQDISIGDILLQVSGFDDEKTFGTVTDKWLTVEKGLFNPYVRGGHIIVNGVAASVHSAWLLSDTSSVWLQQRLPVLYEALLYPVYLLYLMIGPVNAHSLTAALGVHSDGYGSWSTVALVYSLVAAGPLCLVLVLKRHFGTGHLK